MTDRLDLALAFEAAGIERRAAERLADEVFAAIRENVATRQDLQVAVAELRTEITAVRQDLQVAVAELRTEIAAGRQDLQVAVAELRNEITAGDASLRTEIERVRGEIREVEARLIRWVVGTGVGAVLALTGIVTALLKLFH